MNSGNFTGMSHTLVVFLFLIRELPVVRGGESIFFSQNGYSKYIVPENNRNKK
jgi:hypothetical protein